MSVRRYKPGSSRWVLDYYPEGRSGKRIRRLLPPEVSSREQAEAVETTLRRISETRDLRYNRSTTLAQAIPEYFRHIEVHLTPATVRDIEKTFARRILPLLGDTPMAEIDASHVRLYQQTHHGRERDPGGYSSLGNEVQKRKTGRKLSNRTINKEVAYLYGALKFFEDPEGGKSLGLRPEPKPFHVRPLPSKRPIPEILSPEDCQALLKAIDRKYRGVLLLLYGLGLRLREALGLEIKQFDRKNKTISVVRKGRGHQILPLDDDTVRELARAAGRRTEGPLFLNPETGQTYYNIRKALDRAAKKAKIHRSVNHHILRHSIATHLVDAGEDFRAIQALLGHKQITTTQFYGQVSTARLRETLTKRPKCSQKVVKCSQRPTPAKKKKNRPK